MLKCPTLRLFIEISTRLQFSHCVCRGFEVRFCVVDFKAVFVSGAFAVKSVNASVTMNEIKISFAKRDFLFFCFVFLFIFGRQYIFFFDLVGYRAT